MSIKFSSIRSLSVISAFVAMAIAATPLPAAAQTAAQQQMQQPSGATQPTETEKFNDWTLACGNEGGNKVCQLAQQAVDTQSNRPVLRIALTYRPGQQTPTMLMLTPLGVLLPKQIQVQIDAGKTATLPFVTCTPGGCQTMVELNADTVQQMKGGTKFNVTFFLPNEKPVTVPMSLSGFTAGIDALAKKR